MPLLDRCIFATPSSGTADFVIGAAKTGYMTPSQAGGVNGQTYPYAAQSADLTQWEIGNGTYNSGSNTFARTTIYFSSNANAKVSFTAPPTISIDALAEYLATVVTSVVNDTNVTGSIASGALTLAWNGTLGVTRGGNGLATATLGDLRFGSGTNTIAALAGNTTSTKKFLQQTGTGSVSAAPAWGQPAFTDLTGTISAAQLGASAAAGLGASLGVVLSNPTGTASASLVMMGLGGVATLTPTYSTRVSVRFQGTVDNIEIDGGYFTCNSGANGDIIGTSGTPSIGKITVKGVRANSLNSLVNLQSGVVTTPIVEVFDNYGDASAGVIAGSACQVVSLGNKLTSMGSGFVRANGANVTYYDLGGSTNAGTDTAAVNGTEIITAFTPYFIAKQTLSFVNRLATRPAGARTVLYDDFIQALIAAGVWNQLDAMFILGAYDEATALTNMVSSSFGFTKSGSPSFTQGIGYTNTGTTYLDSVFDPSTYGSHKLQQNSASIFAWAREMLGGTVCGIMGADGDLYIDPFFSDGNTYFAVNEGGGASASKPSNQTGLWAASRTASNAQVLYKDGASFITSANASHFNASGHMRVLVDGSFGDAMIGTVPAAGWGAGLNATQHANLYTAIQILLRSIEVSCFQSINASPQTNTLVPSSSTLMVDKKYRIYDGRKLTIQVNAAVRIMA